VEERKGESVQRLNQCKRCNFGRLSDDPQRTTPQNAANANAPVGFSTLNRVVPMNRKTNTSPATDSDQSTPMVAGLMPASLQWITAKESYIA
jgi:hypothetical protein